MLSIGIVMLWRSDFVWTVDFDLCYFRVKRSLFLLWNCLSVLVLSRCSLILDSCDPWNISLPYSLYVLAPLIGQGCSSEPDTVSPLESYLSRFIMREPCTAYIPPYTIYVLLLLCPYFVILIPNRGSA